MAFGWRAKRKSTSSRLPDDIVQQLERHGRFQFDPQNTPIPGGNLVADTYFAVQADRDGVLAELRAAVLPIGGWPAYGAMKLVMDVISPPTLDQPDFNAIVATGLQFLRDAGVSQYRLNTYEAEMWGRVRNGDEPWALQGDLPTAQPAGQVIVSYGRRFPDMIWDAHLHLPGMPAPEVRRDVQLLEVLNDLGREGWLLVDSMPSAIVEWHDYVMNRGDSREKWEFARVSYGKESSMKQLGTMIWAAYIALPGATRLDVRDNVELSIVTAEMERDGWRFILTHPAKGIESTDHYFARPYAAATA